VAVCEAHVTVPLGLDPRRSRIPRQPHRRRGTAPSRESSVVPKK
jgi:hypothetical protein